MKKLTTISALLALGTLLGCGGGSSSKPSGPAAATKLSYTNPTTGEYQLRQNTALSTDTHLVLELWGPATASGTGVTVSFTLAGSAAAWRNVKATDPANTFVANGTAFDLGTGTPILKAKVSGSTLMATVAEKGIASPKALDKPLLQMALDLQSGAKADAVTTLTPDASKCRVLLADGETHPMAVTASTIKAQ